MTTTTLSRDTNPATQTPAARTLDLVKVYGRGEAAVRALDGVTLDLPAGRFTAVMGRRAPASRPCCTASRAWTPPPPARCGSATPT